MPPCWTIRNCRLRSYADYERYLLDLACLQQEGLVSHCLRTRVCLDLVSIPHIGYTRKDATVKGWVAKRVLPRNFQRVMEQDPRYSSGRAAYRIRSNGDQLPSTFDNCSGCGSGFDLLSTDAEVSPVRLDGCPDSGQTHYFHGRCIAMWFSNHPPHCPVCHAQAEPL